MTIKEIEARSGLPRANIRYYESQGFFSPARGENGYRDYSQEDLDTLLKVKLLRQLGFSLEEVRDIQTGQLELDTALAQRQSQLEQEQAQLGQAARLCRDMSAERVSYATLDAERYLSQLSQPAEVLAQDRQPKRFFAFRRSFARSFDLALYALPVTLIAQLFFRVNVGMDGLTPYKVLDFFLPLGAMLVLEPLMLHRWGTTPGKALLGLRIVREDGSYLSLEQAFQRTGLVVVIYGTMLGFAEILPLVTLILAGYIIYHVLREKPFPWETEEQVYLEGSDREERYWQKRSSWKRFGIYLAASAVTILLPVLGMFLAMRPIHPAPTTAAQFVENYNALSAYVYGRENLARELTVDGTMRDITDPNSVMINIRGNAPDPVFSFTEENGVLTAVTISNHFQAEAISNGFRVDPIPYDQMVFTVRSFLGGRPGFGLREQFSLDQLTEKTDSFQFDLPGAQIDCRMRFSGYGISGDGVLFSAENRATSYDFDFTVALTD